MRTVRPAGEKQHTHFTLIVEKICICTTRVSKESLRSHICHIICDLRHSLLLLPRCIIYYYAPKSVRIDVLYAYYEEKYYFRPAAPILVRVDHLMRKVQLYALVTKNTIFSTQALNISRVKVGEKISHFERIL